MPNMAFIEEPIAGRIQGHTDATMTFRDYPAQYYGVYPNYGLYPTNYGYGYRVLPWWC
jgi:hypothetical protein